MATPANPKEILFHVELYASGHPSDATVSAASYHFEKGFLHFVKSDGTIRNSFNVAFVIGVCEQKESA